MKNRSLYILGAGSVGKHVASNPDTYALNYDEIFFLDDDTSKQNKRVCGLKVLGGIDLLSQIEDSVDVVVGIAFPSIKRKLMDRLKQQANLSFPTLSAKGVWISKDVHLGAGCIIYPGCSINYGVELGDFIVMNLNCAIGHDTKVGSFSSLAPGVNLAGHTTIGENVEMGIGSATKQSITIGSHATVGGNSMVIRDVDPNQTVAGVPAKPIKQR